MNRSSATFSGNGAMSSSAAQRSVCASRASTSYSASSVDREA
ncbi:hypothetical protein ACFPRL_06475 [Pseudoclavibacter helvolus]